MTTTDDQVPFMRLPISLPCEVPVLPGSPSTDAPIEERTDCCRTDGFWMIGRAVMCDQHLREVFGDRYDALTAGIEVSPRELLRWEERHRYDHAAAEDHSEFHPHWRSE